MVFGKDFDFVPAVEPGGADHCGDAGQIDAAIAHQCAIVQHVASRDSPIAQVVAEQSFLLAQQFDFLLQIGIPPNVIDVDRNADQRMIQLLANLAGLGDAIDAAAIGGVREHLKMTV